MPGAGPPRCSLRPRPGGGICRGARETFDLAVSRAVAGPAVLCELCLPLVSRREVPGHEIRGVRRGAGRRTARHCDPGRRPVEAVRDYAIPGTDVRHRLIVVEKVKKTPEKYPRMFAKIKKNPL